MSDGDTYGSDEERFLEELDVLAKLLEATEWERRLRELSVRLGKPKDIVLRYRSRLVQNALRLRPDLSEAQACVWVDSIIGLQPAN